MTARREDLRACAGHFDGDVLALWREGRDTRDIAAHLFCHESVVANRLSLVLDRARQDQEWNIDYLLKGVRECFNSTNTRKTR